MSEWKLVPVEPTQEMLRAANNLGDWPAYGDGAGPSEIWAAMLATMREPDWPEWEQAIQQASAELVASGLLKAFVMAAAGEWIKTAPDRLPTREDADENGRLYGYGEHLSPSVIVVPWNDIGAPTIQGVYVYTHWHAKPAAVAPEPPQEGQP